jgi:hypothetical protein
MLLLEHKQNCYNNYQQKKKNIENNDKIDSKNDNFNMLITKFT